MKSIFSYLDYRDFLKDYQLDRQSRSASFSVRSFLKQAGVTSPSYFQQIVKAERNLTEKTLEQFLLALRLKSHEAEYFRYLVHFCQAKTADEKQMHYERLRALGTQAKVQIVGEGEYAFYEHWYIPVLRELLCLVPNPDDHTALAHLLCPPITVNETRQAIKILLEKGFITRNNDGRYQQSSPLLHSGFEVQSLAVRSFNRQMLQLATESLERIPVSERNITGITMSISAQRYALITEEIRAFQDKILRLVESDPQADRAYQLTMMLFPVSQPCDPEKGP